MPDKLKILVSGGGTGGHVFPAIAIANAIKELRPDTEFLFVGANGKIEMEKVPAAGFDIKGLWISGFHRKLTVRNLLFPFKLSHSLLKAWSIVRKFKPDTVVGVGGYASGPVLQVANWMGIPTLIQEQNAFPGVTNRLLSGKVKRICVAFEGMEKYFPKEKIINLGNPVRDSIVNMDVDRKAALDYFGFSSGLPVVFITGGSLGARGVNNGVLANLKKFYDAGFQVIWQSGKLYVEEARRAAKPYEAQIKVYDFIGKMDHAYEAADIIVSRAGGIISELCIVGKPVVLMPSPNVAEDHQTNNALSLVETNAAIMLKDSEAEAEMFQVVDSLWSDELLRKRMGTAIKKLARTDSAEQIARQVLQIKLHEVD